MLKYTVADQVERLVQDFIKMGSINEVVKVLIEFSKINDMVDKEFPQEANIYALTIGDKQIFESREDYRTELYKECIKPYGV